MARIFEAKIPLPSCSRLPSHRPEGLQVKRRTFLVAVGLLSASSLLQAAPPPTQKNPLLEAWRGPYGGVPAFDQYKPAHFPAAFRQAMATNRAELAHIANSSQPPTFANTIAALEGCGRDYTRISTLFGVYTSTANTQEVQAIEREWRPKFAAFADEMVQNSKLFRRIEAVYQSPAKARLTPEQQRLCWLYYTQFVRSGARLSAAQKKQMSHYNQRLALLYTQFSQNVLADEENLRLVLDTPEETRGLPASVLDSAAALASEKGMPGKWAIRNTRSAMETFLTYSERRDLREKAWRMWTQRGDGGGKTDNNKIVQEILRLRARRARLLGFPTFAHWRLENSMAKTPAAAMKLMMQVWPAATARVAREVADMQALADQEGAQITIEPWDYRFYAEKVRKARYDLDENEIKPYLQLDKLRDGLFWMAEQLYDFQFTPAAGVPTMNSDISVFEVTRGGQHVGLWYFDPYARNGKSSGAWMNEYRTQENFQKPVTPIVSNNSNFARGTAGKPTLLSFDDAETMFHEFGHALHGLNSKVHYPQLAGTNVARDFVEFPSQMHEHFLTTPEVLKRFAIHVETGQPMPEALVAKIEKAATFNQGFATTEYLASAIVDMKLHLAGDRELDPDAFEKEALKELGMPKEMIMRHRIPHFGHLFSDDGYAAGYYSYLWSEVLDHDAYGAFLEAGSPYDKAVARRFRENIMEVGNTLDSGQAYRNFRGRDASIEPLLRSRGFPVP
jgi:peptidyl-dipeptidase Dcp